MGKYDSVTEGTAPSSVTLAHLQDLAADAQGTQGSTLLPTGCMTSAKGADEAAGLTKSCVNVCRK